MIKTRLPKVYHAVRHRFKKFKSTNNWVIFKQKLRQIVLENRDECIAVKRIERMATKNFLAISTFDQYRDGYLSQKRIVLVSLMRIILLVNALRYLISAAFPSKTVRSWMSDANYLLTEPRIFAIFWCLVTIVILLILVLVQYQEMNHSFSFWQFFSEIYHKELPFTLSNDSWHKFKLKADLLTKLVMPYMYWVLLISSIIILIIPTFIAYFDPEESFNLISIILWSPITVIWLMLFYSTASVGYLSWYLIALYLKSKFKEINRDIDRSLKHLNSRLLMNAMIKHNLVTKKLVELNEFYKFNVFIVYFIASPALLLLLYLSHAKHTPIYVRIIAVNILFFLFGGIILAHLTSALVRHSAHKPYPLLFNYFAYNILTLKQKLKIVLLIERLTSPEIAFYCLDLFPMNSLEFFRFVCNTINFYILILGFL